MALVVQVNPVLGREVEVGQEHLAILEQLVDRLRILGGVGLLEAISKRCVQSVLRSPRSCRPERPCLSCRRCLLLSLGKVSLL